MTRTFRFTSLALCILLCFSILITTSAVDVRASDYIDMTFGTISSVDGDLVISFSINGTGLMTTIGATVVYVKTSDGRTVGTFRHTMDGYEYMMAENKYRHSSSVTFENAIAGQDYYAMIYFKAGDSTGYDTDIYQTATITARAN